MAALFSSIRRVIEAVITGSDRKNIYVFSERNHPKQGVSRAIFMATDYDYATVEGTNAELWSAMLSFTISYGEVSKWS